VPFLISYSNVSCGENSSQGRQGRVVIEMTISSYVMYLLNNTASPFSILCKNATMVLFYQSNVVKDCEPIMLYAGKDKVTA